MALFPPQVHATMQNPEFQEEVKRMMESPEMKRQMEEVSSPPTSQDVPRAVLRALGAANRFDVFCGLSLLPRPHKLDTVHHTNI